VRFQVIILPDAEQDLFEILAWLKERSPLGAAAWARR